MGKFCNIFTRFFGRIHAMFTKDIGIDLGTANTLVYMKGRGIIMREPSVVAVDPRSDELRVRSVGHEAKAVIGRAPGSIVAVRPLKDGVIADFDITAAMLQSFIRQACGNSIFAHPRVVICVPSGVTEVERRAVRQAAAKAGARQVTVIEEPMAAAIGSGLPTTDAVGSMIVDIGGGTAEVAVISLSGIVASRSSCAARAMRWTRASLPSSSASITSWWASARPSRSKSRSALPARRTRKPVWRSKAATSWTACRRIS